MTDNPQPWDILAELRAAHEQIVWMNAEALWAEHNVVPHGILPHVAIADFDARYLRALGIQP